MPSACAIFRRGLTCAGWWSGIEPAVLAEAGRARYPTLGDCLRRAGRTNLVCCKMAQLLFNIPKRIARVRSTGFEAHERLVGPRGCGGAALDLPEESLTRYIGKLIEYPRPCRCAEFAGGRACLVSVRARVGAPMAGHSIGALRRESPELAMRMVAIYRRFPDEPDRIHRLRRPHARRAGNEVFVLAAHEHSPTMLAALHRPASQRPSPCAAL